MTEKTSLAEPRKKITKVTLDIFRLCGERLQLTKRIGETKAKKDMPIESPKVEEELRNKVLEVCQTYGMDRDFCLKLFELILNESKRVQRGMSGLTSQEHKLCREA